MCYEYLTSFKLKWQSIRARKYGLYGTTHLLSSSQYRTLIVRLVIADIHHLRVLYNLKNSLRYRFLQEPSLMQMLFLFRLPQGP